MNDSVIIIGESSFMNFPDLRESLIRIPEVIDVVHRAQEHWYDLRGVKSLVLSNTFYSPNEFFNIHPEYKSFLSDLVQYALFLRLQNQNKKASYLLANLNSTRAHLLILGLQNLKEFVYKHPAVRSFNIEPKAIRPLHALHTAPKFSLFRPNKCGIKTIKTSPYASEIFKEIEILNDEGRLEVLNLGLGLNLNFLNSLEARESGQITDSVLGDQKLELIFNSKDKSSLLNISSQH